MVWIKGYPNIVCLFLIICNPLMSNILGRADAVENGQATGAMSYAFITALKKNPQQSYQQLLQSIRQELEGRYDQKPQLSCSHPLGTYLYDLLYGVQCCLHPLHSLFNSFIIQKLVTPLYTPSKISQTTRSRVLMQPLNLPWEGENSKQC